MLIGMSAEWAAILPTQAAKFVFWESPQSTSLPQFQTVVIYILNGVIISAQDASDLSLHCARFCSCNFLGIFCISAPCCISHSFQTCPPEMSLCLLMVICLLAAPLNSLPSPETSQDCGQTAYGCCLDKRTAALGVALAGCPSECQSITWNFIIISGNWSKYSIQ